MPKLFVVATPIGNLQDVTPRMLDTFRAVALIAAEDTRVTGNLLRHFDIQKPLTSLHRHNEAGKSAGLIARMLAEGIDVALATDAGTPAISDPGYLFVRDAAEAGIEVFPIAGPTALATALSISGFDAREFAFYGFLPREKGALVEKLAEIATQTPVAVLYESPHRVTALMEAVCRTLPGCMACVCCDLTKRYEKTLRGPAGDVLAALRANPKTEKGEYCVVLDLHTVQMPNQVVENTASPEAQIMERLLEGDGLQDATAHVVAQGVRKNEAKRAALRVRAFLETDRPF